MGEHQEKVDEECEQMKKDIKRLGTQNADVCRADSSRSGGLRENQRRSTLRKACVAMQRK